MAETPVPTSSAQKNPERARRIVDAGLALFLEMGLRGTTMEAIARRAGIAKPTLYGYFPDKESVFRAVIAALVVDLKAAASVELDRPGQVQHRIAAALVAKYEVVRQLLAGSPHARELMSDRTLHAGAEFDDLRDWFTQRIAEILAEAGFGAADALARVLVACTEGLHERARDAAEFRADIELLTARLIPKPA